VSAPQSGNKLRAERFRYEDFSIDAGSGTVTFEYSLDDLAFEERVTFFTGTERLDTETARAAARLVFLLLGVSYYKAAAPPVVDLGTHALTTAERALLEAVYTDGLGEFEARQPEDDPVDLSRLELRAETRTPSPLARPDAQTGRPLVPFGGGIDSTVVVESVKQWTDDAALFVASYGDARNAVIEDVAALTGLPVVRASRWLDPKILQPADHGFRTGHIPVTGLLSGIAVLAGVLDGRDSVVMSNEWSSSSPTASFRGRPVNHQWSKSLEFEQLFRAALADSLDGFEYYSALRPTRYHQTFRSCNRAFHVDPGQRAATWCGECDKCCFIDLVLSPFLGREDLERIFRDNEPLAKPELEDTFRSLLGDPLLTKPWECVGDAGECRTAVVLASDRDDRRGNVLLERLRRYVDGETPAAEDAEHWLQPLGPHHIPAPTAR
jgi:hypothetical protein